VVVVVAGGCGCCWGVVGGLCGGKGIGWCVSSLVVGFWFGDAVVVFLWDSVEDVWWMAVDGLSTQCFGHARGRPEDAWAWGEREFCKISCKVDLPR